MLGILTISAMPMPAAATHGDTAYLIGIGTLFIAESAYVGGPGYLDQYWDFNILSAGGQDYCPAAHGGWDPHPVTGGTPGFAGGCTSGADFATTGIDHYHPYPNGASACAPAPVCAGFDVHQVEVTYDGNTFDAQLVICDNRVNPVLNRASTTYCFDILLFTQHA